MIPVTQTKVVVKNSKGEIVQRGNCYAAAIASIMELPITEVPNVETLFHLKEDLWFEVMQTFITSLGWEMCADDRFKCFHPSLCKITDKLELLDTMQMLEDKYYLVSGKSPRGVSHITIWQNGKMVHDPHPTKEGLLTLETFQSLEKINVT